MNLYKTDDNPFGPKHVACCKHATCFGCTVLQ